ncbi:MAG TPA: hypothetical protein VHF06_15330 [Pseudonocardiaceae bacterium]|nr:hypothetical protein [Pseudonocardiaceae bacterium]
MKRILTVALTTFAGLVVVAGCSNSIPGRTFTGDTTDTGTDTQPAQYVTADPTTPTVSLTPAMFKVDLRITDKECFGSAGCDISYRPSVTFTNDLDALDGLSGEITYQVTGDTSGTQIHTIDFDGEQMTYDEETAQTASSSSKLVATVR